MYLFLRVAGVPERVAQDLAWPWVRLDELQLDARLGDRPEGRGVPVRLRVLLPHDHVEARAVLVAEDEAGVVVVHLGVHEERPAEVDAAKRVETWSIHT